MYEYAISVVINDGFLKIPFMPKAKTVDAAAKQAKKWFNENKAQFPGTNDHEPTDIMVAGGNPLAPEMKTFRWNEVK